ncbi:hypothetical protein [Klenkia terrae]|uniref:Secreted protein n=1 Tax=Klenkia terrae TaxID=1052259 RepID=A0ABU8E380_9ACTN
MPSPQRRPAVRTLVLLVLAAAVLAAAAVLVLNRTPDEEAAASTSSAASSTATPYASYSIGAEPTQVATDAPAPGVDPSPTATDPATDPAPTAGLDVVLTYAQYQSDTGTVQANGFVSGVIEDGGTCTLTLRRDGAEVDVRTLGSADATTTSCGLLETGTDLTPGTWDAQLTYSSATGDGSSATGEVVVP